MYMANNLDEMIKRSGFAKKKVAVLTNNTPETVSRHIHGRTSMRQEDVDLYAEVLGCKAHEISYVNAPIPIIGAWRVCAETNNLKIATRFQVYQQYWKKAVCLPGTYDEDFAAIMWDLDDGYRGEFNSYRDCVTLVRLQSIAEGVNIDRKAIMRPAYIMTKNGVLISGVLWPQHDNDKYTIANVVGVPEENRVLKDIDVAWAARVIETKYQCTSEHGMSIIDHESEFIKKYYDVMMKPQSQQRLDEFAKIYKVKPVGTVGSKHFSKADNSTLKQVK